MNYQISRISNGYLVTPIGVNVTHDYYYNSQYFESLDEALEYIKGYAQRSGLVGTVEGAAEGEITNG